MELVGYRIAAWDTPLWVLPNRRPGRWNDAGIDATQYMALHPLGPWAEMLRNEELRTAEEIAELRPPLWALRVALEEDPVRIDFQTASDHGLEPAQLVGDDHEPCRAVARRLRADRHGPSALVVPSAALPGTSNLVILRPRVAIPYLAEPIDSGDLPTSLTAESGACPRGLSDLVQYKRTRRRHAALKAWEGDSAFVFEEPATTHLAA
jgi:RES domain-containing protein